ncbi:MAG: PBP1A family penicillin-binding protein [Clostridia bacterium]|nr:PBP1A family penicillin-binding protein [Clostridia bacterium]
MTAKKRNKKWVSFLKIFIISFILASVAVLGITVGVLFATADVDAILGEDGAAMDFASVVYYIDSDGNEVEYENLYQDENRVWADFADIPQHVKDAAVAIEDERFYKHSGFDIKSTAYATFNYLIRGSSDRGASTITQQLVKNLTGEKEKKATRKIKEIALAIGVEKRLSKDEILELYLNSIYLGHRCNGVASAAHYYFGKDVQELTIAEGAAIIGITQYPSLYDPIANPEKNKEKQETILYKMHQLGYIDDETYEQAKAEELVFVADTSEFASVQSYFVDQLIAEVLNDLQEKCGYTEAVANKMLFTGGLKIYSTIDPVVQRNMDKVYKDENSFQKAPREKQPESCMTVMDPYTGQVKGVVGGRGQKTADRVLNRAFQGPRQPGSSIKPIAVYGPAIDTNVTAPGQIWKDQPVTYNGWSPKNYGGDFKGPVSLRYAISQSLNTVAVQVLEQVGTQVSYNYMTNKLGFTTLTETDINLASLALGGLTEGVTNLEMTAAYCAFVNDGVYIEPTTYTKITTQSGKLIYEKEQKKSMAFSKETARTMLNLLQSAVSTGTGGGASFGGGYSIAGKTGTTDNDKDRWFVGMTPYYVGAVWTGYDQPESLNFFSGNPSAKVWRLVMSGIHSDKKLPSKYFPGASMSKYTSAEICKVSGLLATEKCASDPEGNQVVSDYIFPSKVPSEFCALPHRAEEELPPETEEPKPEEEKPDEPVTPPPEIDPGLLSENGL